MQVTTAAEDTTPIRRNNDPSPVLAPVEHRFEHMGHRWAVTRIDQMNGDGPTDFADSLTVTHVRTGQKVPLVSEDTVEDAIDTFQDRLGSYTQAELDRQLAQCDDVAPIKKCPHCNGTGYTA